MTQNIGRMAVTTLGLFIGIAVPAHAQQGQGPVAQACAADMGKYCEGIEHGGGKVRACLEANKDKLSSACQAALATHGPGRGMGGMGGTGGQQK